MSMDRAEIMRRATKLLQFQRGNCTDAELQNAAEKLGQLLREHNLSMGEVRIEAARGQIEKKEKVTPWKRSPLWAICLSTRIADPCGCRVVQQFDIGEQAMVFRFIGMPSDAEVASYFFGFCMEQLPQMASEAKRKFDQQVAMMRQVYGPDVKVKTFKRTSYLIGAADTIGLRLWKMIRPPDMSVSERGLVLVKDKAVMEYITQLYPDLRTTTRTTDEHYNTSYARGRRDAEQMPLQHGVQSGASAPGIAGHA